MASRSERKLIEILVDMEKRAKGAWILAQSKVLDGYSGAGAARLENISYAGRIGRLYNLLRRNADDANTFQIPRETVDTVCKLNGIDKSSRAIGLQVLSEAGRIDLSRTGAIAILGATTQSVLEATSDIFSEQEPAAAEEAVIGLSEVVSIKPLSRPEAETYISDIYRLTSTESSSLINLSKQTALIDEEGPPGAGVIFNSNTFRDGKYAEKAHRILSQLSATELANLQEIQERLQRQGALYDAEAERVLGAALYKRLISVGLFDRMEVSNSTESVGYITSPNDFQKYGRPFEEDPIDDAKALIASLTYGQTRSHYTRGQITMPDALLMKLIRGETIGKFGVKAIGEDYRELEARQVVEVTERSSNRFTMRLLKKDVGELARTIVRGGSAAQQAVLMDGSPASGFKGPNIARQEVRAKNDVSDRRFVLNALDRLRSGG